MVEHAVQQNFADGWVGVNNYILRAVRVKYPSRLPELYRTILQTRKRVTSGSIVQEILASSLTRPQKIALFEEGARHAETSIRFPALEALGKIDPALIRTRVRDLSQALLRDAADANRREPSADAILGLIELAGDRVCWDALAAAAPKLPVEKRHSLIFALGGEPVLGQADLHRRERLRLLVGFLRDTTPVVDRNGDEVVSTPVCDYAADRLAQLLGFWPRDEEPLFFDRAVERGPLTRIILRLAVRQAAERELRRLGG